MKKVEKKITLSLNAAWFLVCSPVLNLVACLPGRLFSMLSDWVLLFQKLKGLRGIHLQNVCLLWRQLPMPSLWFQATVLGTGLAPPVAEGK